MSLTIRNVHGEMINKISESLNIQWDMVESVLDRSAEEIYKSLVRGESITVPNVGTLGIRNSTKGRVVKFRINESLASSLRKGEG